MDTARESITSRLGGKVAIVTGAGRGIGRGIARAFAAEGAKVMVASRSSHTVREVVAGIEASGGTARGVTVDVGDRGAVFAMVDRTLAEFGSVDILANNAQGFGTAAKPASAPVIQPLETFDEDEWEYSVLDGPVRDAVGMKAVFPHMKGRGGKIINFASGFAYGLDGYAAYNTTRKGSEGCRGRRPGNGGNKINVNVISRWSGPTPWKPSRTRTRRQPPEVAIPALRRSVDDAGRSPFFWPRRSRTTSPA